MVIGEICDQRSSAQIRGKKVLYNRCFHHGFRCPFANGACVLRTPTAHDGQAVTNAKKLRQIRADHQDSFAGACQPGNYLVDLGLAANIYAASRFVEQEYLASLMQEPGHGYLLLVSSGEPLDRRAYSRRPD